VGAGFETSWPYDERWFIPGVTLDHVVADKRVGVRKVAVHRIPNSDHKAVYAELVLPKGTA
jgi:endonuclease/exonuclease/phosphatase family metal-dependent hydrolase